MTALIKAVIYSLTGYMMAWCWGFGHNKWFGLFGAVWATLIAWDLAQAMLPVSHVVISQEQITDD